MFIWKHPFGRLEKGNLFSSCCPKVWNLEWGKHTYTHIRTNIETCENLNL